VLRAGFYNDITRYLEPRRANYCGRRVTRGGN
jgi:hypothetical protein